MRIYVKLLTAIALVSILAVSCKNQLVIENTINSNRSDELVVIKRVELEKQLGAIPAGKFVVVHEEDTETPTVVQYDDMNGDGQWDEIAWLSSFSAKQTTKFDLAIADAPAAIKAVVRAHVRQIKKNTDSTFGSPVTKDTMPPGNPPTDFSKVPLPPYLTEGPAWENDRVAFRLYFDTRNAKDVFGKIEPQMVLDSVGANHNNSYHALADWGMDVLHVGKSLGAGSLAFLVKQPNGKDTLLRLGGSMVKKETYEVLANGPIRAVFKMQYDCIINDQPVVVTDITSIWGGQYFYESHITLSAVPAGLQLVTGMADFNANTIGFFHDGTIRIGLSYGEQSENKDQLGLAIAVPEKQYVDFTQLTDTLADIQHSYTLAQRLDSNKTAQYRFYAGWEKSDTLFTSQKAFMDFLTKEATKYGSALSIRWE
jgi:hypothetical protein